MSCPFRHLWPASGKPPHPTGAPQDGPAAAVEAPPAQPHTPSSSTQQGTPEAGQCPFLHNVGSMAVAGNTASSAGAAAPAAEAGSAAAEAPPATAGPSAPAVCPLGFGGGQQPKLGEFHCMLCRSLYHDCVRSGCGHRFCAGCIRDTCDCPICGADIDGLRRDDDTQAAVDKYIEAHAGNHTIWELEGSAGQEVDGMAGERSRAAFLLQLGLRAIAAGNTGSARHRFQQCQADLQQQLDAAQAQGLPAEGVAPLRCRLGAVSGCLGDCCRGEGDADGTLEHYQRSVALLQAAGDDPEAQQALSVALNKVGELHHLQGDLAAAADQYAQALQLRRVLLAAAQLQWGSPAGEPAAGIAGAAQAEAGAAAAGAAGEGSQAPFSAALDLAASCLKLASAQQGLEEAQGAEALLAEAEALLGGLQHAAEHQPERLRRKLASLQQYAGMLRQPAGGA